MFPCQIVRKFVKTEQQVSNELEKSQKLETPSAMENSTAAAAGLQLAT
jgi:hypothetical protein